MSDSKSAPEVVTLALDLDRDEGRTLKSSLPEHSCQFARRATDSGENRTETLAVLAPEALLLMPLGPTFDGLGAAKTSTINNATLATNEIAKAVNRSVLI